MREYGQIQCAFWQSDDAQSMTDAGKLLASYLMTGPHSNGIGCYRCPDGYVMEDLGWPSERVSEGFMELSLNGFAYRFGGVVFIPKFLAWNKVANGNVAKARLGEFWGLPKGEAKARAARAILSYCGHLGDEDKEALEVFCETVPLTVPQTVCQTETNPNPSREKPDPDPSSLRSDSSAPLTLTNVEPPADLKERKSARLQQVAREAQDAYNRILAKPDGLLSQCAVLNKPRMKAVEKAIDTAKLVCQQLYGNQRITPQFWQDYFDQAAQDDFLGGRGPYTGSHEKWRPDFEYLLREEVMARVIDKGFSEAAA